MGVLLRHFSLGLLWPGGSLMTAMVGRIQIQADRLLTPRCVACGAESPRERSALAEECPSCGCDFRERPARSYAEMEGLVGHPMPLDSPADRHAAHPDRLIQHWIAFAFFVFLFMIGFVSLATAALP